MSETERVIAFIREKFKLRTTLKPKFGQYSVGILLDAYDKLSQRAEDLERTLMLHNSACDAFIAEMSGPQIRPVPISAWSALLAARLAAERKAGMLAAACLVDTPMHGDAAVDIRKRVRMIERGEVTI